MNDAPSNPVSAAAERRASRKREILDATRQLFDARGLRDAQIEDIARAVGVNRAIIYRHFSGKEELFSLTVVSYLDDLRSLMVDADDPVEPAADRLRRVCAAFLDFGEQFPAFVDCALELLRRPGDELLEEVSAETMVVLGTAIGRCLSVVVEVLEAGNASGEFTVEDPPLLANVLYTQALGGLSLARLRLQVEEAPGGGPRVRELSFETVRAYLIGAAVSMARAA